MTPEVRAIADRFIYEQATLKHMATITPDAAMDRAIEGQSRTVRQLLAHLAWAPAEYESVLARWLQDEAPFAGVDPDLINERVSANFVSATLDALLELFGKSLNALIDRLSAIPDERLEEQLGNADALSTLRAFAGHTLEHAVELLDAIPEIRYDSLVLNWLLSATFETPAGDEWQARLLEDAKAYIAAHIEEYEDEEDEE